MCLCSCVLPVPASCHKFDGWIFTSFTVRRWWRMATSLSRGSAWQPALTMPSRSLRHSVRVHNTRVLLYQEFSSWLPAASVLCICVSMSTTACSWITRQRVSQSGRVIVKPVVNVVPVCVYFCTVSNLAYLCIVSTQHTYDTIEEFNVGSKAECD